MKKSGKFITLEGIDGAGKSTQLNQLAQYLGEKGHKTLVTREPGGTPLGETLRKILLSQAMHPETEALLMFAARREHLDRVILPALAEGAWVISDRFTDASFAYQGGGRGVSEEKLEILEKWVQDDLQPDLTLLFDIPVDIGRQRLAGIAALDRFEMEQQEFFQRVRQAYLKRASVYPDRIRVIDGTQAPGKIQQRIQEIVSTI